MPVYKDKKTKRLRIKFGFNGQSYTKRLPEGTLRSTAITLEAKWKNDLLLASFGIEQQTTIAYEVFLTDHFLPFAEKHYSADGYKNVIVIVKSSLKFLKGLALHRITPADIDKFKRYREQLPTKHKKKRQPATIHRELNIISKVFSYAVKQDFLDYNPVSKVDRPTYQNIQDKIIPIDKEAEFLDNFNLAWARDITVLILNTGLRQNDALGLKKNHVDFDNRIIRITQGKTKRLVEIPINQTVFELLKNRENRHPSLFFPSPKTGKQGTSIKKALNRAGRKTGLGSIGTRVLRRTFATRLAELNYNPSAIAKLLGHSNLKSVHRYERETDILKDAVNDLDRLKKQRF